PRVEQLHAPSHGQPLRPGGLLGHGRGGGAHLWPLFDLSAQAGSFGASAASSSSGTTPTVALPPQLMFTNLPSIVIPPASIWMNPPGPCSDTTSVALRMITFDSMYSIASAVVR